MTEQKRFTWKKKMSGVDYLKLLAFIQDEQMPDIEDIEQDELARVEDRVLRLTKDEHLKVNEFFSRVVGGISMESFYYSLKRKKKPVQIQPVVVQQPVATQTQTQTVVASDSKDSGDNKDNTTTDTTAKVVYPVYDKATRRQMINDMEREPITLIDEDGKRVPPYKRPNVNIADYPFVKNPNEPFSFENLDADLMIEMLEMHKVDAYEIFKLLEQYNVKAMLNKSPRDISNVPKFYVYDSIDFMNMVLKAEELGQSYKAWKDRAEPSEDEILPNYYEYLAFTVFDNGTYNNPDMQGCLNIMDKVDSIDNDTIKLITDDDDMVDTIELKYNDFDSMIQDIMTTNWKFNIDLNKTYNIFGKSMSIMDYVKKMYKKYPDGIEGYPPFYKSDWYAYLAGELELRPKCTY